MTLHDLMDEMQADAAKVKTYISTGLVDAEAWANGWSARVRQWWDTEMTKPQSPAPPDASGDASP